MSYKIVQLKDANGNNVFPISTDNDYQRGTILAVACRSGDVGGTYSSPAIYQGQWMQYGPMGEFVSTGDAQGQERSSTLHISVPAGEIWTVNLSLLVPRIYAPSSSWIVFGIAERAGYANSTIKRWITSAINIQGGNAYYPEYCEKTVTLEAGDYYFCPWLIVSGSACYAYGAKNFQGGSTGGARDDWTTPSAAGSGAWQFGWGAIFTATLVDKEYSTLYAPVEYIQTAGSSYIDTKITSANVISGYNNVYSMNMTLVAAAKNDSSYTAWEHIFGSRYGSNIDTGSLEYVWRGAGYSYRFGAGAVTDQGTKTTAKTIYSLVYQSGKTAYTWIPYGTQTTEVDYRYMGTMASGTTIAAGINIYVGTVNRSGTPIDAGMQGKIYSFKITRQSSASYVEQTMIDLVPVKTLSQIPASMSSTGSAIAAGTYAMYDRVSRKIFPGLRAAFTGPEIEGEWAAEAFVERCEYIQCDGENSSGAMANLLFHPYDLGFYYNGSYLAEVHCDAEIVTANMGTGWQLMMGTAGPSSESYSKRFDFAFRKNNGFDVNMGNAGMTSQGTVTTDRCDYSMVYRKDGNKLCASHTGTFSQEIDIPSGCTTTSAGTFCLGGRGDRDTYYTRLKIYGFKAGYQSASNSAYVRVRDMYPAKTIRQVPTIYSSTGSIIPAGTYCLYDEITKKIYPSVGNQQFTGA